MRLGAFWLLLFLFYGKNEEVIMNRDEIKKKVLKTLEDSFPSNDINEISETDLFREHLDLDSYGLMNLVVSLSRRFSVPFNPSDIERMKNVESIIAIIGEKLDQKPK